jgi:ParB family chromosome partitioning protein
MASLKDRVERIAAGKTRRGLNLLADTQLRLTYTRLDDIEVDPNQPRKDMGDLEGLQNSIQEHGILQPLVVSPLAEGRFRLIAGERRFTAARMLALATVPTIVRTVEDHQRLALQIIENLHRKDLNPLEEAQSYQRLIEEFGLTQDQVAQQVGKSKAAINQTLRILDLPANVKEDVQTSEHISKSVLLEIVKQPTQEQQVALWGQAKRGELTVKKARAQKVQNVKADVAEHRPGEPPPPPPFHYSIPVGEAIVTVVFERPSATLEDVVKALERALEGEKRRLQVGDRNFCPER